MLGRHVVVVGATGVGKTETLLRIAHGAAAELGWHVLYLDAKGDYDTVPRFVAAMRAAGKRMVRVFPDESYDGWRGDALALLNRLMAVENFSEPYYRSTTKKLLQEALGSPLGVPSSAGELLERLASSKTREGIGAEARYSAFFGALGGKLDGDWAFEDADAGCEDFLYIIKRSRPAGGPTGRPRPAGLGSSARQPLRILHWDCRLKETGGSVFRFGWDSWGPPDSTETVSLHRHRC